MVWADPRLEPPSRVEKLVPTDKELADPTPIWRYMAYWKFEDLVKTKSLFLCRIDRVGEVYEGRFTRGLIDSIRATALFDGGFIDSAAEFLRYRTYISCWYAYDHEVEFMWKRYADGERDDKPRGPPVVLQTTLGKLRAAVYSAQEKWGWIGVAPVVYVDYDPDRRRRDLVIKRPTGRLPRVVGVLESEAHLPFFMKPKWYDPERELRIVAQTPEVIKRMGVFNFSSIGMKKYLERFGLGGPPTHRSLLEEYARLDIEPSSFIQAVYVGRRSVSKREENVALCSISELTKELNCPVLPSQLTLPPPRPPY